MKQDHIDFRYGGSPKFWCPEDEKDKDDPDCTTGNPDSTAVMADYFLRRGRKDAIGNLTSAMDFNIVPQ